MGVPFLQPPPTSIITINTSLIGWGACFQNLVAPQEVIYIDMELRAVCYTCQHFLPHIKGHLIRIIVDNRVAM